MNAAHVVVMGVAGCGKSVVGQRIAYGLQIPLIEGDDFHPAGNIQKMRQGLALTDEDRAGWLAQLAAELARHPGGAVLTCSALKAAYRDTLRAAVTQLRFVHLSLSEHDAMLRVAARTDHFYPPSLVGSQFETLQDPQGEPGVLAVDATRSPDEIAQQALQWLSRKGFVNSTIRN